MNKNVNGKHFTIRSVVFALCVVLMCVSLFGCGEKGEKNVVYSDTAEGFEDVAVFEINDEPQSYKLDSIGVEWDPHLYRVDAKKITDEDWELITKRAEYLGIDKVRVWCMPSWYEKRNDNEDPNVIDWDSGNINFETTDMKALIKELDFCQEAGIEVTLTLWGCEVSSWNSLKGVRGAWITEPKSIEEYAENVSILLQWLYNKNNYTCVTGLTLGNEPNLEWYNQATEPDYENYIATCKAVDERLKNDGLRDKIHLILSDDSTTDKTWFENCTKDLVGIADEYAYHTYMFQPSSELNYMSSFTKERYDILTANDPGKTLVIHEFGSGATGFGTYVQGDTDTYERGIFYAAYATQAFANGVQEMIHWVFYDEYYSVGNKMECGLFKYKNDNWETRPFYYSWGLIMKYTEPDSEIYTMDIYIKDEEESTLYLNENKVCGIAFKSPEGKWSYLVVNRYTNKSVKIQIANPNEAVTGLKAYIYSEENVEKCMNSEDQGLLPEADNTNVAYVGNSVFYEIPENTFVLFTNME